MANSVYTTRLLDTAGPGSVGHHFSAAVPVGYVWDVRCITAYLDQLWWFYAQGIRISRSGGSIFCAWDRPQVFARTLYKWEGRELLVAGEQIDAFLLDNRWDVMITGYQLTLP